MRITDIKYVNNAAETSLSEKRKGSRYPEKRGAREHSFFRTTPARISAVLSLILLLLMAVKPAAACTTAIVSAGASESGRPMIWKQRDASGEFNTIAYVRGEKYHYTALLPSLRKDAVPDAKGAITVSRAYAGINEVGFAIANNLSYNLRPDSLGFDTNNGEMMALALGTCRTLEDFAALLDSDARPDALSANFCVIDACGGAAYFEVSDTAYVRFDVPEGGYLYRTNYSLSGDEGRGKGFARYATIEELMARRAGKGLRVRRRFNPGFFLEVGRSFVNVLNGGDALRGRRDGYLYEHEFIARSSTAGAVVIEGVAPGERVDGGVMWCAPGYPPCCYAVPVWVAAGAEIPEMLTGETDANRLSVELKHSLSPLKWPGGSKYLTVKPLRKILRQVFKAELRELKAGRRLDRRFRREGFDAASVAAYNAAAVARFESFKKKVEL